MKRESSNHKMLIYRERVMPSSGGSITFGRYYVRGVIGRAWLAGYRAAKREGKAAK